MGYDAKIPSAMALRDHGIFLRRHRRPVISFHGRELDLPALTVDDATESAFLNAMVFESLQRPAAIARFTSYVALMCDLIVSPKDANLLSTELRIIRNELRSDRALVDLFDRLSSSAYFVPDELRKRINDYCGRDWIRFRTNLISTYFNQPFTILRMYRDFVLLVIGVAQIILAQRALSK